MSMPNHQSLGIDPWNVPASLVPQFSAPGSSRELSQRAADRAAVRQALTARREAGSPRARRARPWRRVPVTVTKTA
jgi:hypothetical protein